MAVDLSVFDRVKTVSDYDRAEQEFQLKKLLLSHKDKSTLPAALQIADAYAQARDAGDIQRMNDIAIAAKSFDKGVTYDPYGNPMAMAGYGDAVGSIEGAKAGYKEQAQKDVDLRMNPLIARGEADQRNSSEANYASQIAQNTKSGQATAEQLAGLQKKADSANNMGSLTDQARAILNTGKPTGSYLGAALSFGKRTIGRSDENTQANSDLDVIAGNLTANIPRMEGPQSDADRRYYQEQAGRVNDRTLPIGDRLSALDRIDAINAKYAGVNTISKEALGIPAISLEDLNGGYHPATPNPGVKPLSLYQKSEQDFNSKKKKTVRWEDLP